MRSRYKLISALSAVLALALTFCVLAPLGHAPALAVSAAVAEGLLSPGLAVLAEQTVLAKSGAKGENVTFTAADFDFYFGKETESILVSSLPAETEGKLMLGGTHITRGQTVSRVNLGQLKFVPTEGSTGGHFSFTSDGAYELSCAVYLTEGTNTAPTFQNSATAASVWTQKDITVFGTLRAEDAEGDPVHYVVTAYPKNGILTLDKTGTYRYTPYAATTGNDAFRCIAVDAFGNRSGEFTVSVKIDPRVDSTVFSDMNEHRAHNAALVLSNEGIMTGVTENGELRFCPEKPVSRAEFLAMAMDLFGAQNVPTVQNTGFADDANIPAEYKGYVAGAYKLGIINGARDGGDLRFYPARTITGAEAAVILGNLLGETDSVAVSVTVDESVPTWAASAVAKLTSLGITEASSLSASEALSRGDVAELLYAALNLA